MPSEKSHINVANENHQTLKFLLCDIDRHLPWIGTVAFYKALHVVEAALVTSFSVHQTTHGGRLHFLASTNRLKNVHASFHPLYMMSQKARYLDGCTERAGLARFSNHISSQQMIDHYIKHHLHQVEQSCLKFIRDTSELKCVADLS